MRSPVRSIAFLVLALVLVSGLYLLQHSRQPNTLPTGRMHDYQLDPPGLADLELGDVDPGVPVLCYHYFRGSFDPLYLLRVLGSVFFGMPALEAREFWTTPVGEFERHLRYFRDTDTRVMTLDEVADLIAADEPLPRRAVVITIDDADRSVYEQAWPLLKRYGMKAHLFVPTAMVGHRWADLDVCSWDELKEMADSGNVLVESHTRHLHFKIRTTERPEPVFLHPDRVPEDVIADNQLAHPEVIDPKGLEPVTVVDEVQSPRGPVAEDILASRLDIQRGAGVSPRWVSWPYGFADDALDSMCVHLGFRGTVSLRPSTYGEGEGTGHVGRFTLTAKTTLDRLEKVFPRP